jgi:hypothetical protein
MLIAGGGLILVAIVWSVLDVLGYAIAAGAIVNALLVAGLILAVAGALVSWSRRHDRGHHARV